MPSRRRSLAILYQQLGQLYRENQNYQAAIYTFEELGHLGDEEDRRARMMIIDRKSTRLNSSHSQISYAVFCLKKKKQKVLSTRIPTPMQMTPASSCSTASTAAPLLTFPSPPSGRRVATTY